MDMLFSPILYAFLAAFLVGTGDFMSRFSSQHRAPIYTVTWVKVMGGLVLFCLLFYQNYDFPEQSHFLWYMTALAGCMNVVALLCLYRALMRGPISIAAPMTSVATLFLTLEWLVVGVIPAPFAYLGIFLSVIGAMCVGYFGCKNNSDDLGTKHNIVTALFALGAAFFFSARLFIMQYYIEDLGAVNALFQARFFGAIIALIILFVLFAKGKISLPKKGDFIFKYDVAIPALQGIMETMGILFLLMASVGDYRVTAPAIFSTFSVVTIFWSIMIFKEKVSIGRWCGIAILLTGVVLMEAASEIM